jgi:hypothetical protein
MNCRQAARKLPSSNRRGKESDGEGKQHQATKCIDCYVHRIGHWKITQLTTIGSDDGYGLSGRGASPSQTHRLFCFSAAAKEFLQHCR